VRVVSVGDFSAELCGGTHVANSGQIGAFKIVSESGIAAGVRRIEGITGTGLLTSLALSENLVKALSESLKAKPGNLLAKVQALLDENKACRKELEQIKMQGMDTAVQEALAAAVQIGGARLVRKVFDGYSADDLRAFSDGIKKAGGPTVTVLASENDGKVTFIVSVSEDLLDKGYHAGKLIKQIAAAAGGGGGGKADMAQAGAKDPSKIGEAMKLAESLMQ
jgi:alanyl-tRNA synthetase